MDAHIATPAAPSAGSARFPRSVLVVGVAIAALIVVAADVDPQRRRPGSMRLSVTVPKPGPGLTGRGGSSWLPTVLP